MPRPLSTQENARSESHTAHGNAGAKAPELGPVRLGVPDSDPGIQSPLSAAQCLGRSALKSLRLLFSSTRSPSPGVPLPSGLFPTGPADLAGWHQALHVRVPPPLTPGALQSIAFMHFSSRHGACPVSCPTDTACGDIAPSCLPPREQEGETPALSTRRLHPVTKWALSGRRGLERRNQLRAPVWNLAPVAESAVTWCLTFTDDGKKKKNHMRRRETTLRDERCSAHPVYPTRWAVNESAAVMGAGQRGWARASGKAGSWVLTGCVLQSSAVLVCEPGLTTGDGQCRPGPAARGEPGAGLAR